MHDFIHYIWGGNYFCVNIEKREKINFTLFVLPNTAMVSITIKSGKFLQLCIRIIFLYHKMFYRWASRPTGICLSIINLIYRLCLYPTPHAHIQNNWRGPGFLRLHGAHARKCCSTVHKG